MTRLTSGALGVALVVVGILLGAYLRSLGDDGALAGRSAPAASTAR